MTKFILKRIRATSENQLYFNINTCAIILFGHYLAVYVLAQQTVYSIYFVYILLSCCMLTLAAFYCTQQLSKHSTLYNTKILIGIILFWAIAFRLIGLFSPAILEDDFNRYLWDAYIFSETGSPYGVPPAVYFDASHLAEQWHQVLDGINYPEITTIYAPGLQYTFLLAYNIQPASLLALKGLFLLADLLIIGLLMRRIKIQYLLLYAWCPLLIKEVAFSAHADIIGILFLLLAIYYGEKKQAWLCGITLALAISCKPFALLLIPILLRPAMHKGLLSAAMALLLIYAPFIAKGHNEFSTLFTFTQHWEFNSSLFALLNSFLHATHAKLIGLAAFLAFYTWYWLHDLKNSYAYKQHLTPRGDWLFGLLLIASPVANPWYFLWVLPFASIFPSRWAWTAACSLLLAYITGINLLESDLGAYDHPVWLRPLEFGLIAIALYFDHKKNAQYDQSTL